MGLPEENNISRCSLRTHLVINTRDSQCGRPGVLTSMLTLEEATELRTWHA